MLWPACYGRPPCSTVQYSTEYSIVQYGTEYGTQYTVPAVPGARVARLEAGHRERVRGSVQADPG